MPNDITVKDSASADKTMAADDVSGRLHQIAKIALGASGVSTLLSGGAGGSDAGTLRATLASDDPMSAAITGAATTALTTITRPVNTTTYTAGVSWANALSGAAVPVIANASRGSGRSGIITDIFMSIPRTPSLFLTGELWIFDSIPSALQDNTPWGLLSADLLKVVDVVEFSMKSVGSSNAGAYCRLPGLNIGFTTVGGADLFVIPKVGNAYSPASSEALSIKTKILRSN